MPRLVSSGRAPRGKPGEASPVDPDARFGTPRRAVATPSLQDACGGGIKDRAWCAPSASRGNIQEVMVGPELGGR